MITNNQSNDKARSTTFHVPAAKPPPDLEADRAKELASRWGMGEYYSSCQPQEWLAEGLLLEGEPAAFAGPLKGMKTTLAVEMTICLAAGLPVLGRFAVPRPFKVLAFFAENH